MATLRPVPLLTTGSGTEGCRLLNDMFDRLSGRAVHCYRESRAILARSLGRCGEDPPLCRLRRAPLLVFSLFGWSGRGNESMRDAGCKIFQILFLSRVLLYGLYGQ